MGAFSNENDLELDEHTVAYYGVDDNSTLHLVVTGCFGRKTQLEVTLVCPDKEVIPLLLPAADMPVMELKAHIRDKTGISPEEMNILLAGNLVGAAAFHEHPHASSHPVNQPHPSDFAPISAYGVFNTCTLTLKSHNELKRYDDFIVKVIGLDGRYHKFSLRYEASVAELKTLICQETGTPEADQHLHCHHRKIGAYGSNKFDAHDDPAVRSFGVSDGDTIHVTTNSGY